MFAQIEIIWLLKNFIDKIIFACKTENKNFFMKKRSFYHINIQFDSLFMFFKSLIYHIAYFFLFWLHKRKVRLKGRCSWGQSREVRREGWVLVSNEVYYSSSCKIGTVPETNIWLYTHFHKTPTVPFLQLLAQLPQLTACLNLNVILLGWYDEKYSSCMFLVSTKYSIKVSQKKKTGFNKFRL